jgi:hypothetical protein
VPSYATDNENQRKQQNSMEESFKKFVFAEVLKKFCILWKLRVKYLLNCEDDMIFYLTFHKFTNKNKVEYRTCQEQYIII